MSGMVRRARRTAAVGVAGMLAMAAVGCTSGHDDADLKVADGGDASAAIAGAVEDARAGSGRYRTVHAETSVYDHQSETTEWSVTGEFSHGASRRMTGASAGGSDDAEDVPATTLEVDGHTYATIGDLREMQQMVSEWATEDGDMYAVTTGDGLVGNVPAAQVSPYANWDFSVLDGKEGVDTSAIQEAVEAGELDPMISMYGSDMMNSDPFELLDGVTDVAEVGDEDLDGTPARHFTATIPGDRLMSIIYDDDALSDIDGSSTDDADLTDEDRAWEARQQIVDDYVEDHTDVAADLYLDEYGGLLKVVVTAKVEIEDQYEECMTTPESSTITFTTDFSDVGGDITIEAPDPALVVTPEALAAAFPSGWNEDGAAFEQSTTTYLTGDPVDLETVDGPRDRYAVMNDLSKFGYVIGLVQDPWTVAEESRPLIADEVLALSDEDLVARYAEVDALLGALPRTATSLGELTRPELLWNVKWGMESMGLDVSLADAMSEAQMAGLIDSFLVDNGSAVGDGVWGDLSPEVIEKFQVEGGSSDEDEWTLEDEFEDCPA
ncbi:hypothetical protein BH10ACT3_BH10ACT3_22660 [soil metagenome]